ncbi:DUF6875 domain-containing protein [Chromobacterium subtsugae]|uniref:DUF6875 domain-containing protein n=1 Tax=Chromobacterium subtsugae TaxID=251747 RepID=UPI00128CCEA0|nr:hypothetical protein [Chromobacterium subtsugae]
MPRYGKLLDYVRGFLCDRHPFRKGAVCPFVPGSLARDRIFFSYAPEPAPDGGEEEALLDALLDAGVDFCERLQIGARSPGALFILFPGDYPVECLLSLHLRRKVKAVERGFMIGVLWPDNPAPSIHAGAYYPLRTPLPAIVVRSMAALDLKFLDPEFYNLKNRIRFLRKFAATFDRENGSRLEAEQVRAARRMLFKHQCMLGLCRLSQLALAGGLLAAGWIGMRAYV